MGVTSVSLPKWKGKYKMSETGSYDKATIKYKKVTAYAETVRGNYSAIRSITTNIYEGSDKARYTWLGTCYKDYSYVVWNIEPNGTLYDGHTSHAFGLRPVIEY